MVMLLGRYSTGKTTFIKHLLRSSYPGKIFFFSTSISDAYFSFLLSYFFFNEYIRLNVSCQIAGAHIGPKPTTYRFVVVMVHHNLKYLLNCPFIHNLQDKCIWLYPYLCQILFVRSFKKIVPAPIFSNDVGDSIFLKKWVILL